MMMCLRQRSPAFIACTSSEKTFVYYIYELTVMQKHFKEARNTMKLTDDVFRIVFCETIDGGSHASDLL